MLYPFQRSASSEKVRQGLVQALEAVEKALACNPSNTEMQRKARDLRKRTGGGGTSATKADKENDSSRQAIKTAKALPQAQDRQPLKVSFLYRAHCST